MIKKIGKVKEVFIPEEYQNDTLIDVMNSTKVGFKVMLDNNQITTVIFKQNEFNSEIFKDDVVRLIQDDKSKEFVAIELYDGDDYE